MHSYAAFGLGISSELKLPELVKADAGSDVVIRRGRPLKGAVPLVSGHGQWTTAEGTHIYWDDVGTLSVRDGSEIVVRAVRNVEERRMRMLLLGAAMGVLLHQRGVLVLHGSAIEVDGEACVFVGRRGWGKSTLAAGMVERGYRLLADDVVAIDSDGNGAPTVLPAFPQLKLWPDAIIALGRDPRRLRRLSSGFNKRERRVRAGFRTSPVRLRHVFVLAGGPCVEVEATQPHVALLDIIANLYVARFGTDLLDRRQGDHLPLCAEIGRKVPICRLNRPRDLQLIPRTVELVRRHIACHSCTRAA